MELSKELIEKHLRIFERDDSLRVMEISVEQACEVGDNFISDVKRVGVIGRRKIGSEEVEYKIALIIKLMHSNKELTDRYQFDSLYRNEMLAYNEFIPELLKRTVDGELHVPKCIYASENMIILEDLSAEGFRNVGKREGFRLEQVEAILRALAKLHSASIVSSQKEPKRLENLSKQLVDLICNSSELQAFQTVNLDIAIKLFRTLEGHAERNRRIIAELERIKTTYKQQQRASLLSERPYKVLNHGDTWGNNILVNGNEVRFVDLQCMRFTSVASDLSYFLYINLKPSVRRENLDRFYAIYLEALNANIAGMGLDLQGELTVDWLKREMSDFALVGFVSALWLLPVFFFNQEDLNMENFKEEDIQNVEWQWAKCTPEFKERLEEIVLDYVEFCT